MTNIIPLKAKEDKTAPLIWVCQCGCSTFELLSTSEVRCPACDTLSPSPDGAWYAPETDAKWDGDPPMQDISANGDVDFARRRTVQQAEDDDTCVVVSKALGNAN